VHPYIRRFYILIALSWLFPPVVGLGFLLFIKMFSPMQMLKILITPLEPAFILGSLGFALWYFWRFAQPVGRYLESPSPETEGAALKKMQRFPLHYWTIFLIYLLLAPTSVLISAEMFTDFVPSGYDWFRIHLVALIVSIIVGLPIFFLILDLFGRMLAGLTLQRPHVSIKLKIFLIGALVPLLLDTMLVQYYWTRTGYFSFETFVVWLMLEILAIAGSLIFVRSIAQSLSPLQEVIAAPLSFSDKHIENLNPVSTDELGVLAGGFRSMLKDLNLYNEILQTNLRLLVGMGQHTNLREVSSAILDLTKKALGDNLCFLILYDSTKNVLIGVAQTGLEFNQDGYFQLGLDETSHACEVFQTGLTIAMNDAVNDPRSSQRMIQRFGIISSLAAPLKAEGKVIGVLMSTNHQRYHAYSPHEITIMEAMAREAALAVHSQLVADQRRKQEKELILAASVFRDTQEGIVITDARGRILRVNEAFTRITGYSMQEVIGRTPRLLRSGRHDKGFYKTLWMELKAAGVWQGEIWSRRKNGELFPEWLNISAVLDEDGKPVQYIGIFSDFSEKKLSEERIYHLAHYDILTELPNRVLLQERLGQAVLQAQRHEKPTSILFVDLDYFKRINDTLGHAHGDKLLQVIAQRLLTCVRRGDTVARQGGDEFIIVVNELQHENDAALVAEHILAEVAKPIQLDNHEVVISASIGISLYPNDAQDVANMLKNADAAMYRAKEQGRGIYQFFTPDLNTRAMERLTLESKLRRALSQKELRLEYQPQIDDATGSVTAVEALLRWQNPELGRVMPMTFITVAEETGEIIPIGEWVLRQACLDFLGWQKNGCAPERIAINISARQFRYSDFVSRIKVILEEIDMPARNLELELTESALITNSDDTRQMLHELKALGAHIALDDFGTGYSSLTHLKRFPIDVVKIDKSFVLDILKDPDDAAIIEAVIRMGQTLDLRIVAEGVENEEQLAFLRNRGCREMQGYYLGRPMPADELQTWLRKKSK
jgi:diguanylate cyclase (GGDEF)-like protein/PAS domain S-box-containing protein